MKTLLGDIRYSLRVLRQSPVFTLTAVLTLALGIGGTTGIFSLIHAVMLRSLPVADPASLYRIGESDDCCVEGGPQGEWGLFSFPLLERLKAAAPQFEQVTAFQANPWQFSVRRAAKEHVARPIRGEFVTGNYFSTFGVGSFAGRVLSVSDDQPSAPPVAVLSYRAWKGTYGGDPSVLGSSFVIEGHPFTVIGIAPPGFFGETLRSDPPDLWFPLQQEPLVRGENSLLHQSVGAWLRVIGRLRPGASVMGMSARLTEVMRQWLKYDSGYPPEFMPEINRSLPKQNIHLVPAGSGVASMKADYGSSLAILLAVCCLVLLIACANVANLLLARGMARRSQTSLRVALGASRARLIRQALTESVLLALAGGLAGLLVADGAGRLILALAFHSAHFLPIDTSPSMPVLGFAFALALVTGVLFGTAPAWFSARTDPVEALRGANRTIGDSSSLSQKALLVLQATLSVVLVAGAGILTRSLNNLESQNFGIQAANRISVDLNSPPATYSPERLDALYRGIEERLSHLPGVERASLALYNPLTGDNWSDGIAVEGLPASNFREGGGASWDRVSAGYFETVGQPVLRGRGFTEADTSASEPVTVVNQEFVRKLLPNVEPLGHHFGFDIPSEARRFRIVGVVRDAKYAFPDEPLRPMFFVPLAQRVAYQQPDLERMETRSHLISNALIVTRRGPGELEPVLRKLFSEADPNLTIIDVRTMQQEIDMNFDQQRSVADLAGIFGLLALVLAAVGLYGVTAYTVARRTNEIGVRMALGADRAGVVKLVLRGAFKQVAAGLLIGIPLAIGAGRLMASQLYGVGTWDPLALSIAMIALCICAFTAAMIPATRAASIDPMQALRTE